MLRRIPVEIDMTVPEGAVNTYLIGEPGVLIDPVADCASLEIDPTEVAHVAVTHTHPDHVLGVQAIREETDATVWAFRPYRERFERASGVSPDRIFREGEELGDSGVSVFSLPGHSPDHVGFCIEDQILVGDLARSAGSVMVGDRDGDMRAYLISLRRLIHRDLGSAYPGHGPPIEDPEARFRDLLAHRLERERLILRAVAGGARTPTAIVTDAYSKDLTGVEEAAKRTVRAHLMKLAVEGRVDWDGTVAQLP